MKYAWLIFYVFSSLTNPPDTQYQLLKRISIEEPADVSVDKAGNVYYGTFDGDVVKYGKGLDQKLIFSPSNPSAITSLEAQQGLRIFSFHRDLQQFRLINRTLALNEDFEFLPDQIGFAETATSSFDNNVWVVDQRDFSLKKYNITSQSIASTTPLDLLLDNKSYQILYCKEYQNRLFVSTKNSGILIFDSLGNYLKTFPISNVTYFNFWKNSLYYLSEGQLVSHNLYNDAVTSTKLPQEGSWKFAIVNDDLLYLFTDKEIFLYK